MPRLLKRLALILVVLAGLYWLPVNVALNLPATQAWLNRVAPQQFALTWRYAWSPYPLRLVFRGVAADGETPGEQWQVDATEFAVSLSLLPLLRDHQLRVHDLTLVDLDLRLRPRARAGAEDLAIRAFYPEVRHRDPAALAEPVTTSMAQVRLAIDTIRLRGRHTFWVAQSRGRLPGAIDGSFRLDSAAGEVGLTGGRVDLQLSSLRIGAVEHVTDAAWIRGRLELPALPLDALGTLAVLALPEIDADLDIPVQTLDFLPYLAAGADRLGLHGHGRLRGHFRYHHGELQGGSTLDVTAKALTMQLGRFAFSGDGAVSLRVDAQDEQHADLTVRFADVEARRRSGAAADGPPLFIGRGVEALLHTRTVVHTADNAAVPAGLKDLSLTLTIPSVEVPDLSVHNPLLPEKWQLRLLGGVGVLSGRVVLTPARLDIALDLGSDEADLRWRDTRATTDLLLQVRAGIADAARDGGATLDLSGTLLRIDDAEVAAAPARREGHRVAVPAPAGAAVPAAPWHGALQITEGRLRLPPAVLGKHADALPAVLAAIDAQGLGALLGRADGRLAATLTVSQLDWIAELLHRPLGLALHGHEELDADLALVDGWPAVGSTLAIPPTTLTLDLLKHRVQGQGGATLKLEQAGRHSRLRFAAGFKDALMYRDDEAQPGLGEVRLDATVLAPDPLNGAHGGPPELTLKLHSARVRDMAVYNAYLPVNAPLALVGGSAALNGELRLGKAQASGNFLLTADALRLAVDQTQVTGNLRVQVVIRDGDPADLRFDITGSALVLDGVRVAGATASTSADWHARLQLEETEVVWRKPMQLRLHSGLTLRDTRPFVALLDNFKGEHPWLDDLLTVKDLAGHINLVVDGPAAVIEDAMLSAAELGVHVKGRATADRREAMVLLRWHNLLGGLELVQGQRYFDLPASQARYAAWQPGRAALPARGGSGPGAAASASRTGQRAAPSPAAAQGHGAPQPVHRHGVPAAPANPFLD